MNRRILFSALLIMIISSGIAMENDAVDEKNYAKLSAVLDPKAAYVGDVVTLKLIYTIPDRSRFTPESNIEGIEDLTIIDRKVMDGEIKLFILVDKIESFEIGPFSISFEDDGNKGIIKCDSVSLEVLSNLGENSAEAQLKPIVGIIPTTPLWLKYLSWIIVLVIVILVVAGILWWRRKQQQKVEGNMAQRPSHIIAIEEIQELRRQGLFEKGHYKEFYFRLSEILREYLERLRGFPAAEYTTEEIARRVKSEIDRKIIPLLREADLVKFADSVPTIARKDEDVRRALMYIQETTPISSVAQHSNR